MTEQENEEMVRRFFQDVMSQGNTDLVDKLVADDYVDHEELPGREGQTQGPQAVQNVVEVFRAAFPDLDVEIEQTLTDGDLVAARTTWSGTHKGELFGVEPTNETVEFTAIDIVRIEDGLAREHWGLTDNTTLLSQIGAIQPPEA